MTNTTITPAGVPTQREAALAQAAAAAEARFVLEQFETEDGDNRDPVTKVAPKISMWGVFDVTQRQDGRNGMVWLPKEGFQAAFTEADGADLCAGVRSRFVAEAMAAWDAMMAAPAVPDHQVIRLDSRSSWASAQAVHDHQRLAQLVALYDQAKAEADAAAANLKEIVDGIKAETRRLFPHQGDFTITSGALAHPLTLQRTVSRVFDTAGAKKVLSAEQYDALCKDRESWVLKAKRG
jgi:hypothetical protein